MEVCAQQFSHLPTDSRSDLGLNCYSFTNEQTLKHYPVALAVGLGLLSYQKGEGLPQLFGSLH